MTSSAKGLRVLKSINTYTKNQPSYFDPHNIFNKINILSLSNGSINATFKVDKTMCNAGGIMHGGFIASVLDTSAAYAQLSLPNSRVAMSTNLNVNFFKQSEIGNRVTVETVVLKTGKNPVLEAMMRDEAGSLIAKSVISFTNANEALQKFVRQQINLDEYDD